MWVPLAQRARHRQVVNNSLHMYDFNSIQHILVGFCDYWPTTLCFPLFFLYITRTASGEVQIGVFKNVTGIINAWSYAV